jgi:hypothetical protein
MRLVRTAADEVSENCTRRNHLNVVFVFVSRLRFQTISPCDVVKSSRGRFAEVDKRSET